MPPQAPPAPPPYGGRLLDMKKLVREFDPTARPPWVVEPLVIAGTLTVLAGKMGSGKTWVMHEAANAVARGIQVGGLQGYQTGRAGIIDAEMGPWLTTQRFAQQGYAPVPVLDATGWNLMDQQQRHWVFEFLEKEIGEGGFVGIDSLKRLTPSSKENLSDDMSAVVSWLAASCKRLGIAGLLIHHAGWEGERIRGSSAIGDPADAVWHISTTGDAGEQLTLSCTGADQKAPRYCPPPPKLGFVIQPGGGLQSREVLSDTEIKRRGAEAKAHAWREVVKGGTFTTVKAIRAAYGSADNHVTTDVLRGWGIVQDPTSKVFQVEEQTNGEGPPL